MSFFIFSCGFAAGVILEFFLMRNTVKQKVANSAKTGKNDTSLTTLEQRFRDVVADQKKKEREAKEADLKQLREEAARKEAKATVSDRLLQAIDIGVKQSNIDLRKGNDEIMLFNTLELKKLNILKTILNDGFDPEISVQFSTGIRQMTVSQYVASIQKTLH